MYVKTTWEYAGIIEVHKHHTSRYGDHRGRAKKSKETGEREKASNERRRRDQLYRILAANFQEGEAHATLTYKAEAPEEKREIRAFLRRMRKAMEREGKELKYIYVTEHTKKGKAHHHMVMNVTDMALIRRCWTAGGVKISPLYPEKDYQQLADYLLKDQTEKGKRRYHMSKNLEIPQPKREIIRSDSWREEPKPKKGYWIPKDSVVMGITAEGYPYQRYRMIRIEQIAGAKRKQWLEKEADKYIRGR